MNETDNYKPSFFKRLFIFGSTPRVMLNCLGMMVSTILLLWLVLGLLKCYTQHNKTFEIPNFVDMNVEEVKSQVPDSRFDFEFSESAYNRNIPKGIIISQDPIPGDRAKNGRTIYLTYNPLEAATKVVPKLYGLNIETAKSALRLRGFEHKIVKKVIDPTAPGTVQSYSYDGKTIESRKIKYKEIEVKQGETIELVVSEDYNSGSTQVPDLVCLTYSEALFKLRNGHNLMLGDVAVDATVTDTLSSYVVGQYPFYAPGEYINIGSQVDLRVSQNKPVDCDGGGFGDYQPGRPGGDNDNGATEPENDEGDAGGF